MTDKDNEVCKDLIKTKGFGWRISLTIIMGVGWLIFLILWLFFYASNFNIYQNIAIFIVSILILGGVIGASWAPWGMKYGHKFDEQASKEKEKQKTIDIEKNKELEESK